MNPVDTSSVSRNVTDADLQIFADLVESVTSRNVIVKRGSRYGRIVIWGRADISEKAKTYAFVDMSTGNIYRAASNTQPAKGIRGNIFAENVRDSLTPEGVIQFRRGRRKNGSD